MSDHATLHIEVKDDSELNKRLADIERRLTALEESAADSDPSVDFHEDVDED